MKQITAIFILLWIPLFSSAQEKVFFGMFELLNVHEDYQYSTSKLLRSYVNNHGKYFMIIPEKEVTSMAGSIEGTQEYATSIGAPYFLVGEMNALQDVLILTISMHATSDGKVIWSDMLKASGLDDLDPIMILISRSMGTRNKASELEDIYSVTSYKSSELGKKEANSAFGIYIGGIYTVLPGVNRNFSSGFGGKITYDVRNIILDINGDLFFGDINFFDINLSALHPLTQEENSLFVGGGLGYGGHGVRLREADTTSTYGYNDRENSSGLLFYGHIGYLFNRTSSVQMRGTLTAYTATYEVDTHVPAGLAFNLTFSF